MRARSPIWWISQSSLKLYEECPREWYYRYRAEGLEKLRRVTDYPALLGNVVHYIIWKLYEPTATPRPFYYQSAKTAVGAFIGAWNRNLAEHRAGGYLMDPDEKREKDYLERGAVCVATYWRQNVDLAPPIEREAEYRHYLGQGIGLLGKLDQVRCIPLDPKGLAWIAQKRPELIRGGQLIDGYDPVVIVDFKTGYPSYDLHRFGDEIDQAAEENPEALRRDRERLARLQFTLHEGLQPTMYTFLYEMRHGRKPVGFFWYHLRSGRIFFTSRDERHYEALLRVLEHVINSVAEERFPTHVSPETCNRCPFQRPCSENRDFAIAPAEEIGKIGVPLLALPNPVVKSGERQLRIKFPPRKRQYVLGREKVAADGNGGAKREKIVLRFLPWDEREPRFNVPIKPKDKKSVQERKETLP